MILKIENIPYHHNDSMVIDMERVMCDSSLSPNVSNVSVQGSKYICENPKEFFKYKIIEEVYGDIVERWCVSSKLLDVKKDKKLKLVPILIKHYNRKFNSVNVYKLNTNIEELKTVRAITSGHFNSLGMGDNNVTALSEFLYELLSSAKVCDNNKTITEIENFINNNLLISNNIIDVEESETELCNLIKFTYSNTCDYDVSKNIFYDYVIPFFKNDHRMQLVLGMNEINYDYIKTNMTKKTEIIKNKNRELITTFNNDNIDQLNFIYNILMSAIISPFKEFVMDLNLENNKRRYDVETSYISIINMYKKYKEMSTTILMDNIIKYINFNDPKMKIKSVCVNKLPTEELYIELVNDKDDKEIYYFDLFLNLLV